MNSELRFERHSVVGDIRWNRQKWCILHLSTWTPAWPGRGGCHVAARLQRLLLASLTSTVAACCPPLCCWWSWQHSPRGSRSRRAGPTACGRARPRAGREPCPTTRPRWRRWPASSPGEAATRKRWLRPGKSFQRQQLVVFLYTARELQVTCCAPVAGAVRHVVERGRSGVCDGRRNLRRPAVRHGDVA